MKRDGISGGMMLFGYDELKKHVQEDFGRFAAWGLMKRRFFPRFWMNFSMGRTLLKRKTYASM